MLVSVLILVQHGLSIACLGLVLSHGIGYLTAQILIAFRLRPTRFGCLDHLYYAAAPAGGMVVTWLIVQWLLKNSIGNLAFFVVSILLCGSVFILIAIKMDKTVFSQVKQFFLSRS